jgi:hypothetical protein
MFVIAGLSMTHCSRLFTRAVLLALLASWLALVYGAARSLWRGA